MKKRIISIILAVIMVVEMLPLSAIPAFAEGPAQDTEQEYLSETIYFQYDGKEENVTAESEHFMLEADCCGEDGWYGGCNNHAITVTPKNNEKLFIRNIEAVVSIYGNDYIGVGISSGTKRELGNVDDGTTVHIDNVKDYSFSFDGGVEYVRFKEITIFYEVHTHVSTQILQKEATETEHGISTTHYYCEGCGQYFSDEECTHKISKETAESYIIHKWSEEWSKGNYKGHYHACTYAGCDAVKTVPHTGYIEDGICDECDYSGTFAETICFHYDGEKENVTAESEQFKLVADYQNPNGWQGGGEDDAITITAKNYKNLLIRKIEAVVSCWGDKYNYVGISSGTKRETGDVENGTIVHIDDVNDWSFSFDGGDKYVQFKEITIFYEVHTHVSTLIPIKEATETEHGSTVLHYRCDSCGKCFSDEDCKNEIDKETAAGYIIHNWSEEWSQGDHTGHYHACTCAGCDAIENPVAHTGYSEDGVCDDCGYCGIFEETIEFVEASSTTSEHFTLTAGDYDFCGWNGGSISFALTITPKNSNNLLIREIEAIIGFYGYLYSGVGVSSGTKREAGDVEDETIVHIDDVNAWSFSFKGGEEYVQFKDITVFYEFHTHELAEIREKEMTETEHGILTTHYYCEECGKSFSDAQGQNEIDKETADGYIIHNWSEYSVSNEKEHTHTCTICNKTETAAHTGYSEDGICDGCGYSGTFAETIYFSYDEPEESDTEESSTEESDTEEYITAESDNFMLTTEDYSDYGWIGGSISFALTITPKNSKNLLIRRIEAIIGYFGYQYSGVGVSSGTKRETGDVENGSTAHVDDVDEFSFSFADGDESVRFKDITVYFDFHKHELTEFTGKPATETEHGKPTYYKCDSCGKYYWDADCENETDKETAEKSIIHFTDISYEWSDDYLECTATETCLVCHQECTEDATKIDLIEDTPGADCQTMGKGHYEATFDTIDTAKTAENGTDTKLGDHKYVDFVCEYCNDELLSDAQHDAIRTIDYAADRSDDEAVKLLAKNALDAIQEARTVAAVLTIKNLTISQISAIKDINAEAGKKPGKSVKRIADGAKADISSAESIEDVESIRDECLADIKKLTGTTHEHTYSENWSLDPYYHWHDSTCEHTGLTSGFAAHTFGEGVASGNATTYTCEVCGYEKTVYQGGSTEGESVQSIVKCDGISLTLDSNVYMNFYMQLTEEAYKNGTMTFEIGGRTLEGVKAQLNESNGRYFFACQLNALEMAETVKATFTYGNSAYMQTYSIKEYVQAILDGDYIPEMKALARKIANYGYYAQEYLASIHDNITIVEPGEASGEGYDRMIKFSEFDIDTEKAIAALAGYEVAITGTSENISLYGSTVYFDSATALNYYIKVSGDTELKEADVTAVNTETGKEKAVEIIPYTNTIYIVSVKDILATELADDISVTLKGELTLTGSVLAYCNAVMTKEGQTDEAKNAMAAFYEYYDAAVKYAATQS